MKAVGRKDKGGVNGGVVEGLLGSDVCTGRFSFCIEVNQGQGR